MNGALPWLHGRSVPRSGTTSPKPSRKQACWPGWSQPLVAACPCNLGGLSLARHRLRRGIPRRSEGSESPLRLPGRMGEQFPKGTTSLARFASLRGRAVCTAVQRFACLGLVLLAILYYCHSNRDYKETKVTTHIQIKLHTTCSHAIFHWCYIHNTTAKSMRNGPRQSKNRRL